MTRCLSDEAVERLEAYRWPGNVREMRNLMERLHLTAGQGMVGASDLPPALRHAAPESAEPLPEPAAEEDSPASLTDMEARAIRRALVAEDGNLTRVAAVLGISRPTLYRKLKAYGIRRTFE